MKCFPIVVRRASNLAVAAVLAAAVVQSGCGQGEVDAARRAEVEQELQGLRTTNQELQRLRAENQELPRLRRDNEELQRIQGQANELEALRRENAELRGQLQAAKQSPRR